MGSSSSKGNSFRSASSSSWSNREDYQNYPSQQPYPSYAPPQQPYQGYPPPPQYQSREAPPQDYGHRRTLERRYSRIADDYRSLDEVILRVASVNFRCKCSVVVLWVFPLDSVLYMLWISNISSEDHLGSDLVGK